jgi:glycosyltransferase involved in cell wall biosynthesis
MQCAIDSALGQDYDNVEVIVVNDGSTDNTDLIARGYGDKIRYFSKENGGVSTALNLAIQNAKGEYISWLSHDDYYLPNKVSRQIEELRKLESREKILICGGCIYLDLISNMKINSIFLDCRDGVLNKIDTLKFMYADQAHICSFLIPSEAFHNVDFFDTKLCATQDFYLWFKFIHAGYLFFYIPEFLMVSRIHNQQVSVVKLNTCRKEEVNLWNFANKLFCDDIKKAPKNYRRIFKKRSYVLLNYIKRGIFLYIPVSKIIWYKIKAFMSFPSFLFFDDNEKNIIL